MTTEVKFGEWLGSGFDLYKQHLGALAVPSFVALLLTVATGGILAGPMMAGMAIIALHVVDGKEGKPEVGLLFQGFQFFLPSLLFFLVWGLLMGVAAMLVSKIMCVGPMAAMAGSYVVGTLLMFAIPLIVDRKLDFWPASMESLNMVKPQLLPLLGFYVVAMLIGGVGAILCVVGVFLTMPISALLLAIAYRAFYPAASQAAAPEAATPSTQP